MGLQHVSLHLLGCCQTYGTALAKICIGVPCNGRASQIGCCYDVADQKQRQKQKQWWYLCLARRTAAMQLVAALLTVPDLVPESLVPGIS